MCNRKIFELDTEVYHFAFSFFFFYAYENDSVEAPYHG